MAIRREYVDEDMGYDYDEVGYSDDNNSYDDYDKKDKIIDYIKKFISIDLIFILLISVLASLVSFGSLVTSNNTIREIQPFGYALIGAISIYGLPLFLYLVAISITTFSAFGALFGIKIIVFSGIFMILLAMVNIYNVDKKIAVLIRLMASSIITEILFLIIRWLILKETIVSYDIFISIYQILAVGIFYAIFASGIYVIKNYAKKVVFSREELIAAGILLAVCSSAFAGASVFGASIRNVIGILIVLILGYKNGVLVGATAGTVIGLILSISGINSVDSSLLLSTYALSGLISGLFNKYGKLGVSIGFIIRKYGTSFLF